MVQGLPRRYHANSHVVHDEIARLHMPVPEDQGHAVDYIALRALGLGLRGLRDITTIMENRLQSDMETGITLQVYGGGGGVFYRMIQAKRFSTA